MPFKHELNNKEEVLKRVSYVLYVMVLFFSFCFSIMAIATWQGATGRIAALLGISAIVMRLIGSRYLEFPRLALSFPMGVPEDDLSYESRLRFERLIEAFYSQGDWCARQDIRDRIAEMVSSEPLLAGAFRQEILDVHPNLLWDFESPRHWR